MNQTDSTLTMLKQLLKQAIGLDASTVGEATIRKFLGQRMRACKLENIEDYYNFLQGNNEELAALLETAVIPETWFFRDIRPFNFILDHMQKQGLRYFASPCNILCIPCSTGEEPYSIAMHLLHAGIPARSFQIRGVDISQRALDIARLGYYGNNSFRNRTDQKYLDRYFSWNDGQYRINDDVRERISFSKVNILDPATLPADTLFDFILCRNLLIYFDISTKAVAFQNLHRILRDDGVLFIGHSEFGAVPKNLFTNTGAGNAFGLIKFTPPKKTETKPGNAFTSTATPGEATQQARAIIATRPAFAGFATATQDKTPATAPSPAPANQKEGDDSLQTARQLADAGNLLEAETLCLRHTEQQGESSGSFFLLALINEASGKTAMAENLYRKALYLEPKHYESLIHLALLLESHGDNKNAALLRQRAERAKKA